MKAALPDEWDPLQAHGHAIAGTPAQVRDFIADAVEAAGATYFVCDFAFGTISHEEAMRSVELFAARGDAGLCLTGAMTGAGHPLFFSSCPGLTPGIYLFGPQQIAGSSPAMTRRASGENQTDKSA